MLIEKVEDIKKLKGWVCEDIDLQPGQPLRITFSHLTAEFNIVVSVAGNAAFSLNGDLLRCITGLNINFAEMLKQTRVSVEH